MMARDTGSDQPVADFTLWIIATEVTGLYGDACACIKEVPGSYPNPD